MTTPTRPSSWLLVSALAFCASGLAVMGAVMAHVGHKVTEKRAEGFSGVHIPSFEEQVKDPNMAAHGAMIFRKMSCSTCHGARLEGVVGPCLTDPAWIYGGAPREIRNTINHGSVKGMPSFASLDEQDKTAVVAYILSRQLAPVLLPVKKGEEPVERDMVPAEAVPKTQLLTPGESLADFRLPTGCKIECLASEPIVVMPVSASFDARGRLWVAEMRTFMRDVKGTDEFKSEGRLAVLEDTDGDGVFDKRTDIFTNLVSPRALLPYNDGILFADDTRLLWAPIDANLKPGPISVVDRDYAKGGTVEHKPNGLLPHLDGWIYNAKSGARYRRMPGNDTWQKSASEFRGQWGIGCDDFGRLVTNTNSNFAMQETFPPNFLQGSPLVKKTWSGRDVGGTACHPRRMTPGINRAYLPGGLDIEGKLKNCTSACGPWVARGAALGGWQGLFVCEPTSHLLKYIRLDTNENGQPQGSQPLADTEFLTSTDELFRPVNLTDSPDGSLLVLDMHVGIVQHKEFVSAYLRRYVLKHGLEKFTGFGRLYRIRDASEPLERRRPDLDTAGTAILVRYLEHESGWWRDMARRQIIERGLKEAAPALRALLTRSDRPEVQAQALWALTNLGELHAADLAAPMAESSTGLRISACEAALTLDPTERAGLATALHAFTPINATEAAGAARVAGGLGEAHWKILDGLLAHWADKPQVKEAALVGLGKDAASYANRCPVPAVAPFFAKLNESKSRGLAPPVFDEAGKKAFDAGKTHFASCIGCHGADGAGLANLGPPLDGSEWVIGDKQRMLAIMLCGLSGPITVADEKFNLPLEMPALGQNPDFDDKTIAALATYVRNAWGNRAPAVTPADVAKARAILKSRKGASFTEAELLKLFGKK